MAQENCDQPALQLVMILLLKREGLIKEFKDACT